MTLPLFAHNIAMKFHLAISAAFAASAYAADVGKHWKIGWIDNVNPDGKFPRRAIGINGKFPHDPVSINSNDFLHINVSNAFGDGRPTTLHAHGLYYQNVNYFDGAANVAQCPIPDGQSFNYEILNSPRAGKTESQWGTYWLHGHYKGQYTDGLRTPFIIHNADGEVYDYDDDYTVALTDWYHEEHGYLKHHKYLKPDPIYPTPKEGLMYFAHTKANQTAKNLPGYNENATLPFEPGKTYRLRLINMSAASRFDFWIEGHDMDIIEADGTDVKRFATDVVQVGIGQRYSVLVKARNSAENDWRIHADMEKDMYGGGFKHQDGDHLRLNLTSKVSYGKKNAKLGKGRKTISTFKLFDDLLLEPVHKESAETKPDMAVTLMVGMNSTEDGIPIGTFNGTQFKAPLTPPILTMKTENDTAIMDPKIYGPNSNAVVAPYNSTVELKLVSAGGAHPFHLHGTKFQLVERMKNTSLPCTKQCSRENPLRRDTVILPAGGSVTMRFRADNPGAWMMHCHMDWHLAAGLAMMVIQAPREAKKMLDVPSYFPQQCRMQGLPVHGNAGGVRGSTTDFGRLN